MIVTVGESLVDIVDGKVYPGGSPLNVAMAAARLESSAAYIGRISSDEHGKRILGMMIENLVMFDPAICSCPQATTKAEAVVDGRGDVTYRFSLRDTASMTTTAAELRAGVELALDMKYLFAGSLGLMVQQSGEAIVDFIEGLEPEIVVFIDPNVRLSAMEDMASSLGRLEKALRRAGFCRFSSEDIRALYGEIDEEAFVSRVFDLGVSNVIVTRAADGASWYTADGRRFDQESFKVDVADTIGCGDTFDAAILHSLDVMGYHEKRSLDGSQIKRILRFASAASAENCKRSGCNPPALKGLEGLGFTV